MPLSSRHPADDRSPRNLCELLLRDVAGLLATNQIVRHSLRSLRHECQGFPELARGVDLMLATSEAGESHLHEPLVEAGAVLFVSQDAAASELVRSLFARLATASSPGVRAAEIAVNLRLIAQHIELRARLAAEAALLVGQNKLCQGLITWAGEWQDTGEALRTATVRARAHAYIADVPELAPL